MIQGAGTEGEEVDDGRRILEHAAVLVRRLLEQGAGQLQVRTVGDTYPYDDPGDRIAQRPVDEPLGHQLLVGDDHLLAVEVGQGGGANADPRDGAGEGADGDGVTDPHRTLEQYDDAGDEVGEDLLHAKTDTDRQTTGDPLQLVPLYPHHGEGGQ